ncbi:hypothetical protein ACXR2U_20515 [Jatrophihabitans sp. YIM 134969]
MIRRVAAGLIVVVLAGTLTACAGSAQHVRDICGDVTSGTAELDRYDPARPLTALQFALGRFDLVEEAVGKAREASLPEGDATTLRTAWLDPAVTSMGSWEARLQAVRTATTGGGDPEQVQAALTAALALGTEGVDTAALDRIGYGACATAFTAPTVASTEG